MTGIFKNKIKPLFNNLSIPFKDMKDHRSLIIKNFICLAIIYAISIIAIIRANFKYIDDLGRVAGGYAGWSNFSRYTSSFLSTVIHGDTYLTDISPLTQLLAVVILALSSAILLYILMEKKTFSIWGIIAVLPLGLSPYFLECISYKYDSPYMALSILASIFPFILYSSGYIFYSIASFIGTIIMCTTYQAASGIYPMIVVLLCFIFWSKGKQIKDIFKLLIVSVLSYGIGMLFFRVFLMLPAEGYVSNSIPSISQIIPETIKHLYQYFMQIITDFKNIWLILIVLMGIACLYIATRDSTRKKYFALPVAIITFGIMALLCFGLYPVLSNPLYDPRAMYGFGVFIALMGVFIANAIKVYPAKIVCFALSWLFIGFSFTYGNALSEQINWTNFRVTSVIQDLNDLEVFKTDEIKTVQLDGNIGKSPVINNMPQDYQMLNRLVPTTFGGTDWYWQQEYFYSYFGLKNIKWDVTKDLTTYDLPVIKDTMYHTIKGNDEYVLIELK